MRVTASWGGRTVQTQLTLWLLLILTITASVLTAGFPALIVATGRDKRRVVVAVALFVVLGSVAFLALSALFGEVRGMWWRA